MLHTRPTCIYSVCQDPPATLTPEKDNVFRNWTLLFKQKTRWSTERKNNFTKEIIQSLLRKTTFPPITHPLMRTILAHPKILNPHQYFFSLMGNDMLCVLYYVVGFPYPWTLFKKEGVNSVLTDFLFFKYRCPVFKIFLLSTNILL